MFARQKYNEIFCHDIFSVIFLKGMLKIVLENESPGNVTSKDLITHSYAEKINIGIIIFAFILKV